MAVRRRHLHEELKLSKDDVTVMTANGPVTGGRARNGAVVFLEVPYALPPGRFEDPKPLPRDYRYEKKLFKEESAYAVQPNNDGQAAGTPFEDKVGFGKPTENPLFLNIVAPPSFPHKRGFPVKIYIHGGFLQFGSPHSLSSQAQYIAASEEEIWVNIGYRLSAFGFLACDNPRIDGNYGFKDQWLGLEWVKKNIEAFGGDPDDIQISGLSAGAHSVHQLLHHAAKLPLGEKAPFHSAVLQSNAILTDPKTPAELRLQFQALCRALKLDLDAPDLLPTLKDPMKVPWSSITHVIETDKLGEYGTFRGCLSEDWISTSPGPMENQRLGQFSKSLQARGIRSVVVGDLTEEWYLYSIAHPIRSPKDIVPNLERYFPDDFVNKVLGRYPRLPENASSAESQKLFGEILSCLQVHLPVRVLARDLEANGFPVLRYEIRWTPEQLRSEGYVTHGSDRALWALREPVLDDGQIAVAKEWIRRVSKELKNVENSGGRAVDLRKILTLKKDRTIQWTSDKKWDEMMSLVDTLPGEPTITVKL